MGKSNKKRAVRGRMLDAFRRELLGPTDPNEIIKEYPTTRYIVGRLAPSREDDDDMDGAVDPLENDALGAGGDDDEAGSDEPQTPLTIGFNPSSIGLSFLVSPETHVLQVEVSWQGQSARYRARQTEGDERQAYWQQAVRMYPGFQLYEQTAGERVIPVIVLEPLA